MFESVLFPAPFSPRSACTSPAAASKSTPSFATTPGKRFTIPRAATAASGEAAVARPAPLVVCPSTGSRAVSPKAAPAGPLLAGGAPDHALHEPVHPVEAVGAALQHLHPDALRHAQLAVLVVQRARELVERAVLYRLHLRGDRGLRRRRDTGAERRELREAVLDRAVVEPRLPRPVHGGLHALQVVRPPVVDRGGQPRLRRELLGVRVVPDPRDPLGLGVLAGGGRVDVLSEHACARGVEALRSE